MKTNPKQTTSKRKKWFEIIKKITTVKYKRPTFIYLGEKVKNGALILSNHEGTEAPMSLEIYLDAPIRFWGAYQMNSGLKSMYKYQSEVYYHQKKGWNLFLAKLFCIIASPLTNLFYRGIDLISTYPDSRLLQTVRKSKEAILRGENLVIFPEKSDKGYLRTLEGFYSGFAIFTDYCLKQNIDVPIFISYYNKHENVYIFDKPINYSTLKALYPNRDQLAKALCDRCNEIGELTYDKEFLKNATNDNEKLTA